MKRLYVISDSHGYRDFDMLLAASRDADAYAHLGDHASDGEEFTRKNGKFTALVRGNCDPGSVRPDEEVITLDGVKILLVHGHTLGVKYSLTRLTYRARRAGRRLRLLRAYPYCRYHLAAGRAAGMPRRIFPFFAAVCASGHKKRLGRAVSVLPLA